MQPIQLTSFRGDWPLPSPSPFCLKLETWLRMVGLPYELDPREGPPRSRSGKLPYVTLPDGAIVDDSQRILERLTSEHGLTLDAHLDEDQRATSLLVRRLVEDHLYFATLASRWLDDRLWHETARAYFGHLPWPLRAVVPWFVRRKVRRDAWGHGVGRRPLEEVYAHAVDDLQALSHVLADQPFFLGRPCTTDAVVFGTLENIRAVPLDWPGKHALDDLDNLLAFCDRMRAEYWGSDWPA